MGSLVVVAIMFVLLMVAATTMVVVVATAANGNKDARAQAGNQRLGDQHPYQCSLLHVYSFNSFCQAAQEPMRRLSSFTRRNRRSAMPVNA